MDFEARLWTSGGVGSQNLSSIVDDVRQFSPREQHDDITLIIAKGTEN
jgi:hypothetical protein